MSCGSNGALIKRRTKNDQKIIAGLNGRLPGFSILGPKSLRWHHVINKRPVEKLNLLKFTLEIGN